MKGPLPAPFFSWNLMFICRNVFFLSCVNSLAPFLVGIVCLFVVSCVNSLVVVAVVENMEAL